MSHCTNSLAGVDLSLSDVDVEEGREDVFGKDEVSANDNDVAIAFGVLGEDSGRTFPNTGRAPKKITIGCDECVKVCKARGCANVSDVMFVLIW